MDRLHNHLRLSSGMTLDAMWVEITRLRRLGCRYEDLPADKATFEAGLRDLHTRGLASRTGSLWIWEPAVVEAAEPATAPAERMLFW